MARQAQCRQENADNTRQDKVSEEDNRRRGETSVISAGKDENLRNKHTALRQVRKHTQRTNSTILQYPERC